MRSPFLHPLFLGAAALFIAHQLSQKVWGLSLPWADSYLDPLLCMPLLLTGYTAEQAEVASVGCHDDHDLRCPDLRDRFSALVGQLHLRPLGCGRLFQRSDRVFPVQQVIFPGRHFPFGLLSP